MTVEVREKRETAMKVEVLMLAVYFRYGRS